MNQALSRARLLYSRSPATAAVLAACAVVALCLLTWQSLSTPSFPDLLPKTGSIADYRHDQRVLGSGWSVDSNGQETEDGLMDNVRKLHDILTASDLPRNIMGGNIAASRGQADFYAWQARRPGVFTICESGFQLGHSATLFLTANPNARMVSLDIVDNKLIAQTFIKETFPGRFFFVHGDSTETIPKLRTLLERQGFNNFTQCDLISIDGNFALGGPLLEMRNWQQYAHHATTVLVDDCKLSNPALGPWSRACVVQARSTDLNSAIRSGLLHDVTSHFAKLQGPVAGEGTIKYGQMGINCWCEARYMGVGVKKGAALS